MIDQIKDLIFKQDNDSLREILNEIPKKDLTDEQFDAKTIIEAYFREIKNIYQKAEERREEVEKYLKELLTLELDEENKTNIRFNIRRSCQSIIWKEHYKLLMQLKNIEAINYLDDFDNWKKAEKEVREKLHVPDSIPIIYK